MAAREPDIQVSEILAFVRRVWSSLESHERPRAYWLRRYPVLSDGSDSIDIDQPPSGVWYFDGLAYRSKAPIEWTRFWKTQELAPSSKIFGDPYEIGLGAFAPYETNGTYYVETMWAGRRGRAYRLEFGPDSRVSVQVDLWAS